MQKTQERLEILYQNSFFKEHKGLAEALIEIEAEKGVRIPNQFIKFMPKYEINGNEVTLGKIDKYYVFGIKKFGYYEMFDSKQALRIKFSKMEGMKEEDYAYWAREIEQIPDNLETWMQKEIKKTNGGSGNG